VLVVLSLIQTDWWLVGISAAAFFLSAVIGQGLRKNAGLSFSQLARGDAHHQRLQTGKWRRRRAKLVARAVRKFAVLATATVIAVAIHLGAVWWGVVGTAVIVWFAALLLGTSLSSYRRPRRST
jgi:hypothetical protein